MAEPEWVLPLPTAADAQARAENTPPTERDLNTARVWLVTDWQKRQYAALRARLLDPAPMGQEEQRYVMLTLLGMIKMVAED